MVPKGVLAMKNKASVFLLTLALLFLFCSKLSAELVPISTTQTLKDQPTIHGTEEFKETIGDVFKLLKEKDYKLYNWYASNVDIISFNKLQGTNAINQVNLITGQVVITFDTEFYKTVKSKYNRQDVTLIYLATLAHECAHTPLRNNYVFDNDVEGICNLSATRALEIVGAKNTFHYKIWKDGILQYIKL